MTANWRKLRRIFVLKVLHADDSPHRIALGVAIGTFVGFTPTVGFQTIIAIALAAACRVNKLAAIPMVWITNVVTAVPIYALCHHIGAGLVGTAGPMEPFPTFGFAHMLEFSFWADIATWVTRVGAELWTGCLLVGFIGATISYFVSRWAVTHYRHRRQALVDARNRRRAPRRFTKPMPARRPVA